MKYPVMWSLASGLHIMMNHDVDKGMAVLRYKFWLGTQLLQSSPIRYMLFPATKPQCSDFTSILDDRESAWHANYYT